MHKGTVYPGEHRAIVERETWDRVHSILAENARRGGNRTRQSAPALLQGLIRCAACGRAMAPSHARKNGKRYRYYVCQSAIKNGHDSCPVRSLPAGEVEEAVANQIRALLKAPEMAARTLAAARRDQDAPLPEADIVAALAALDPVWEELFPAEQARIVRLLVETVNVRPDGIDLELRGDGMASLIAELAPEPTGASEPAPKKRRAA